LWYNAAEEKDEAMPSTPSFREELISQIPALHLLINLGYTYLSPDQVNAARGGRLGNVLLDTVLEQQLRKLTKSPGAGAACPSAMPTSNKRSCASRTSRWTV